MSTGNPAPAPVTPKRRPVSYWTTISYIMEIPNQVQERYLSKGHLPLTRSKELESRKTPPLSPFSIQLKMSSSAEREPVCHFGYSNMYLMLSSRILLKKP
ncbi:hypothetical protein Aspvir_006374 [Aspergillus viridinutans]|uniref:Uncharacterized protein n=1 Tax=Aspergillus viridinutans TaxID=75553 RepID=A0A9P3BU37_ASPVI|nr:uncharacterized protein Aspvir_006374 [Aspergillus viridinutans]GIK02325.1 hypothetical protein Aspvir_006374 [Aspergillus viridinutans]